MRTVIGFDPPSVCNLGYAEFELDDDKKNATLIEAGLITLKNPYDDEAFDYDFAVKTAKLEDFLDKYYVDKEVQEIVVEQQILGKRGNRFYSPFLIAQTNNMSTTLQRMAYRNNIERQIIHNKTLKKNVVGNGNAKKDDVMDAVVDILGLNVDYGDDTEKQHIDKYEHAYDALALVLGIYMGLDYKIYKYRKKFVVNVIDI